MIILITNRDGSTTKIELPDGVAATVTVTVTRPDGPSQVTTIAPRPMSAPLPNPTVPVASPFPPLDPTWVEKVRSLPPEGQVAEVGAELKRRNPQFQGPQDAAWYSGKVEEGQVIGLTVRTQFVRDLTPVRALPRLARLTANALPPGMYGSQMEPALLTDLAPLRGLPLTELQFNVTEVRDLAPLAGMPLTQLRLNGTLVADLAPLQGAPLTVLELGYVPLQNLEPLPGMPL